MEATKTRGKGDHVRKAWEQSHCSPLKELMIAKAEIKFSAPGSH